MSHYDPEVLEYTATMEDGTQRVFRRCGFLPDVFADQKGNILRLQKASIFQVGKQRAVKYRNSSLTVRNLVADAWLSGWKNDFDSLEAIDGNLDNCEVSNLRPVNGHRGRPSKSDIMRQAEIYQLYKVYPDVAAIAAELKCKVSEVYRAVGTFDERLLHLQQPE